MRQRVSHLLLVSCAVLIFLAIEASAQTATFKVLHSFTGGSDGAEPLNGLVSANEGRLYGTTQLGGTGCPTGCGTVFELAPSGSSWTEKVLYAFPGYGHYAPGPTGTLSMDARGHIYGTTLNGGDASCKCGTVYELSETGNSWTAKTIHKFTGPPNDGENSYSGLVVDEAGNLYGTTYYGGSINDDGTLFELSPTAGGWGEQVLVNFNESTFGMNPYSGLTLDAAGNLYGTTSEGGVGGDGTVFKLAPSESGWVPTTVYAFTSSDGVGYNLFGVTLDSREIFGVTDFGGVGDGNVFKLTNDGSGWSFANLYAFKAGTGGLFPNGEAVIDQNGSLYGVTMNGGVHGLGTLYRLELVNGVWTETVLHTFTGATDGGEPFGKLVLDSAGNLFGVASMGGAYGLGVVFEVSP